MKLKSGKPTVRKGASLELILNFYDAFLREESTQKVAAALQVGEGAIFAWIRDYPEFALAKKMADEKRGNNSTFTGYIFQHLSPEARKTWEKIQFWRDSDSSYEKINEILSSKPKKLRQELFIHALISCSFDVSTACAMVAISRNTLEDWKRYDLDFRQLVEEVRWHKKNFFEKSLIDLVEMKHPAAVIFVNRTVNADRGYSEKIQIEHTGTDPEFSVEDLDLDLETRRKVLDAIRRNKEKARQQEGELVAIHKQKALTNSNSDRAEIETAEGVL